MSFMIKIQRTAVLGFLHVVRRDKKSTRCVPNDPATVRDFLPERVHHNTFLECGRRFEKFIEH